MMTKLKVAALGLLIAGVAIAQMGGGPGLSNPPVSDDPSFDSLSVTGTAAVGGTATFTQTVAGDDAAIRLLSAGPGIHFVETDAPANEQDWKLFASGGDLSLWTATDAGAATSQFFRVQRTGTNVNRIQIGAAAIELNGSTTVDIGSGDSTVWHDVDSAGNGGGPLGIAYARTNSSGTLQESKNVSSVTNDAGTGAWTVNFTANTFNDDPVCSVSTVGAGMAYQDGPWSSSSVGVETRNQSGTLTDLGFTITCLSTD